MFKVGDKVLTSHFLTTKLPKGCTGVVTNIIEPRLHDDCHIEVTMSHNNKLIGSIRFHARELTLLIDPLDVFRDLITK